MKRASLNSHRQYNSVDEEARARLTHRNLLQEFLELQKEFVSKKKKLQAANQKRETLLAEVPFLRQRYSYLSMTKPQDSVQSQNPSLQSKMAESYGITEAVERRPWSLPDLDQNVVREEGGGRSQIDVQAPTRKKQQPKNCLVNAKRVGKKKISWQDQVALKV